MRFAVFSFLFFLSLSGLSAQAWEILNFELKVAKEGNELSISFIDERNSLQVEGDTAFVDEDSGLLFFRNSRLLGIIDPFDLVLLQEASFLSLQTISTDIYLVEDENGYYLSEKDYPLIRLTDCFESVECLSDNSQPTTNTSILLVERKGKYGIIIPGINYTSYILEPKYDEIIPGAKSEAYFEFLLRKGSKWGVGNCDGIIIPLKYDELELIGMEWESSAYIAWKGEKCGVVTAYLSKPAVEIEYTYLTYLKKENQIFLFLFKDEDLVGIRTSDAYEEWDNYYEPVMVAHFVSNGKIVLIYRADSELFSIEVTDDELQRLGLASMDWMYFEN